RINTGLREFLQKAHENDFALFYFAGHGAPDPNRLQDLYLLAHDSNPKSIASTALLMRRIQEDIKSLAARSVLVLADASHSAGLGRFGSNHKNEERSAPLRLATKHEFRKAGIFLDPIHEAFFERMRHSAGGLAVFTSSEAAQLSLEDAKEY